MGFLGLDLDQRILDAKTIWLFRETLAQTGVVDTLFEQFDAYLAAQGLQPRGGQLIDGSLILGPQQRYTREENAAIQAGQHPTEWDDSPTKRRQKDTDAGGPSSMGTITMATRITSLSTNRTNSFGAIPVTDAAVHDSQVLEAVWHPAPRGRGVWADSAYRSQERESFLKMPHLRSHIQEKGYRDKPLTAQQKERNRGRARTRVRVEHVFGHQVMAMGGKVIRTIGVVRA